MIVLTGQTGFILGLVETLRSRIFVAKPIGHGETFILLDGELRTGIMMKLKIEKINNLIGRLTKILEHNKRSRVGSSSVTVANEIDIEDARFWLTNYRDELDNGPRFRLPLAVARLCERALATYGYRSQERQTIEEMSELTKAICKKIRKDGRGYPPSKNGDQQVVEEIADVQIMLWQLSLIYDPTLIEMQINKKLERLNQRLSEYD